MNGVINVLKPPGMTSHDVVSFLRRELQEKRIGHAGTLDPQAAGVLPVCVGQATRLAEYLGDASKEYLCQVMFGITTNTQDAWGEVVCHKDASALSLEQIEQVIPDFLGEITQIIPAYSAVKVNGVPLYKLARQGRETKDIVRRVKIDYIRIVDYQAPVLTILVGCSKGTYIRTLCHDLGQRLGVGAHMSFLLRTRVGHFGLNNSRTVEEISELSEKALLPPAECVRSLEKIVLSLEKIKKIRKGQQVQIEARLTGPLAAVFSEAGDLQAIAEITVNGSKYYLKPKKVLKLE